MTSKSRYMCRVIVAGLTFVLLCATARLSHSATAHTLHMEDIVLQGVRSSHEVTVELHRPDVLVLTLEGQLSELVSPELSSLGVRVDDRPVRHVTFARLERGQAPDSWRMRITLPELSEGFHRISVHTALHREEDPCFLLDPPGAWVRVQRMEVTASQDAWWSEALLATFPALWHRQSAQRDASDTNPVIIVELDDVSTPEALATYLAADSLVREHGFKVALSTLEEPSSVEGGVGVLRVELDPQHTHASLLVRGSRIIIRTPDWSGARRALRALGTPRLLRHCQNEVCVVPEVVLDEQETRADGSKPRAQVQRIEDLGFPQGWVARGPGTHTLQTTWTRPAHWEVSHEPTYRMTLHTAMNSRWIDISRSVVRISLNGIPLDQYSLESSREAGASRYELVARVPESFWLEESWTFVVEVVLHASQGVDAPEQCHASNTQMWVRLDPSSGLWVPRQEQLPVGISAFGATRAPTVVWSRRPGVAQAMALGALLHPFAMRHGPSRVVRGQDACAASSSCLFMSSRSDALPEPFELTEREKLVDRSGLYVIPEVDVARTLVLDMRPEGLNVWIPEAFAGSVTPPDYAQLLGPQALLVEETWLGAPASVGDGEHVAVRLPDATSPDEIRDGETRQLVELVELLWWAVLAASCVGVGLYISRRARASDMAHFDPRGYEELERHDED